MTTSASRCNYMPLRMLCVFLVSYRHLQKYFYLLPLTCVGRGPIMVCMSYSGVQTGRRIYDGLADKVAQSIASLDLQPGQLVASEYDIARQEGVSRATVRKAVGMLVARGLVERRPGRGIYVPKANAAARLVQIVMPNWASPFCGEIARGVKEAGLKAGVRTQIHDAHGRFDSDLQAVANLPNTAAEGAIIASVHNRRFARILYELEAARYPFVLVDETLRDIDVPSVVADNYGGGYLAGQKLIGHGHRRIAFVGFLGADTVQGRLGGLRDAMANVGLPLPGARVGELRIQSSMDDWSAEVVRVTKELLRQPNRPTAIFFYRDDAAADGCRAIRELGLRIPEDISVVGFDGLPICRVLTPTLATVRQPAREMGAAAMEMLLALIEGGPKDEGSPLATKLQDGYGDAQTPGGGETVADRRVASMETDAPKFSRPRRPAANRTGGWDGGWHRVLPVIWQEGDSIGPAPAATRDFTKKDTRNTKTADGSRSPWRLNCAADGAKDGLENPGATVAVE